MAGMQMAINAFGNRPEFYDIHKTAATLLATKYPNHEYTAQYATFAAGLEQSAMQGQSAEMIQVGMAAPEIAMKSPDGKSYALSELKGKVVLLDFWASWCVPCRKAIPALKQFYQENSSKDVEIISVSIDKKDADWVKANNVEQFPWHSFLDRAGLADAYNVKAIPAMFLLTGEGKVVAENVSLEEIKTKIR